MRSHRTLIPVLALGAASLVFAGVSAALDGGDPPKPAEPTTVVPADCSTSTTTDSTVGESTDSTVGESTDSTDTTVTTVKGDDGCEEVGDDGSSTTSTTEESTDTTEGTTTDGSAPDNHGAAVSEAAHTCPPGPEHGACVSDVARSDAGKPDQAHGTTDTTDTTVDGNKTDDGGDGQSADSSAKPEKSNGKKGQGQG